MTEISANSIRLIATIFARPHFRQVAVTLLSVTALLASVFLYSRNNNFSSFYHPDERVKARQVGENKRLYLHPQLLLEATDLALKISRHQASETLESLHKVILTGRWVSAILAGLTVVALGLVGYFYAGFGGLVLGALSVGLCPSLLINAHYMKEDTALVFGIALTLLAALMMIILLWAFTSEMQSVAAGGRLWRPTPISTVTFLRSRTNWLKDHAKLCNTFRPLLNESPHENGIMQNCANLCNTR